MNTYKVGDKVLYDGKVHTVIQVPDDRLTLKDVGYLDKDYVVLDLGYDNAVHYTEIEPYLTPYERLAKLGWKPWDTFDYKYSRPIMGITLNKDINGWYFITHNVYMDKEILTTLLEYLEELENEK